MKEHTPAFPEAVSSATTPIQDTTLASDRVAQWAQAWAQLFRSSVQETAVTPPAVELLPKLSGAETSALKATPEAAK